MSIEQDENKLYETNRYRCLFRTSIMTEDLYYVSCGIERCYRGKIVDMPDRPGYHMHVVLNGKGSLNLGGRTEDVHSGQIFLLKPGEPVIYKADDENPWTYCWVTFDGMKAKEVVELAGFSDGVNLVNSSFTPEEFMALVQKILDHSELNYAYDLMRLGLILEFLSKAVQSYNMQQKRGKKKYREYSQENYVSYAVSLIDTNYGTLQVEDIAKTIGIHRSHLASIFKKQMGISPQEYLLSVRIKNACSLLRETQMPIKEIAGMVGYDNPLTFSKTFKKFKGIGPREYRNAGEEEIKVAKQRTEAGNEEGDAEN